jgi:hypothetical protein
VESRPAAEAIIASAAWTKSPSGSRTAELRGYDSIVHVTGVDLAALGVVLPADLVGIVCMQPAVSLSAEPFRWLPGAVGAQLAAVQRTLDIALLRDHGAEKTHFTLFPEYSIPGITGIEAIHGALSAPSWPTGTVVVAGIDALTPLEFQALCAGPNTAVDRDHGNDPATVQPNEWVNCSVTWVKANDGRLLRWVQPKLEPAWPEQNIIHGNMFRGRSVYCYRASYSNGVGFAFLSLVCFDWIATHDGQSLPEQILQQLNDAGIELSLGWLFVLEHNEKPSHPTFLTGAARFFENRAFSPLISRDHCAIVFANTAGRIGPGSAKTNGESAVILSPAAPFDLSGCHPTYTGVPTLARNSEILARCKDALFRERGACITSFSQYPPRWVDLSPAGRSLPLRTARVHATEPAATDPRVAGAEVPCPVKWVNDMLDEATCLSDQLPGAALAASLRDVHEETIRRLRGVDSAGLQARVDHATYRAPGLAAESADHWAQIQRDGVTHVLNTLDNFGTGGAALDVSAGSIHADAIIRGTQLTIVATAGPTHEDCLRHIAAVHVPPERRQVVLVTRDLHNTRRLKRDRSILEPDETPALGQEVKFTDSSSGRIHIGFHDLLEPYMDAVSQNALEEALYERLTS